MSETRLKCDRCKVEFEPKTPILFLAWDINNELVETTKNYGDRAYYYGCWAAYHD